MELVVRKVSAKNELVRVSKPDLLQEDYLRILLLFDQCLKVKSVPFEALNVEQEDLKL